MSVLKPNRNETDFKVVSFAIEVRREITTYVIRDFAVEGKLDYMEQWFLNDERTEILHDKRIMSKRQIDSMNRLYSDLFGGLNNG